MSSLAWESILIGGKYSAQLSGGVSFHGTVSSRTDSDMLLDLDEGGYMLLPRSQVLRIFKPSMSAAKPQSQNGEPTMPATAKRKRSTKKATAKTILDVPVSFGGVSIGQDTARVGIKIERGNLALDRADECFCGKRLTGKIILGRRDDAKGQGKLIEDTDYEVAGAFDVKRIGVSPAQISTGLTFALASVDVGDLSHFAKGQGRMVVENVAELPDGEEGKEEWEPGDDE